MRRSHIIALWALAAVVAVTAGIAAVAIAQGGSLSGAAAPMAADEVSAELERVEQGNADGSDEAASDDQAEASPTADASDHTATPPGGARPTGGLESAPEQPAADGEELFPSDAGTVLARCTGGRVELVWWAPEQGFAVTDVEPGPTDEAEVEFEGGGGEYEYTLWCNGDTPDAAIEADD